MYPATVSLLFTIIGLSHQQEIKEYCTDERFQSSCADDEVMLIQYAKYGRMKIGDCLTGDFGHIGPRCTHDVAVEMDAKCSGRRQCDVEVKDSSFRSYVPCHKDLKSYLEASFTCIQVVYTAQQDCHINRIVDIAVDGTPSFIGNIVTEETGCGGADNPWILKTQPGQRINITMMDFGVGIREQSDTSTSYTQKICRVYATLREKDSRSQTVCGGDKRVHHIYTSDTDNVEIRILNSQTPHTPIYFVLKVEAIGCADPNPPKHGKVERGGNRAVFSCNYDKDTSWHLSCEGDSWKGEMGNCSAGLNPVDNMVELISNLPNWVAIAIVLTIAVIIGGCILLFGLMLIRRKRENTNRDQQLQGSAMGHYEPTQLDKRIMKTLITNQSPTTVATEVNPRENEYASMKYYMTRPDEECWPNHMHRDMVMAAHPGVSYPVSPGTTYHRSMSQPNFNNNGGRPEKEHIYESPESIRRHVADLQIAEQSPQYFDLDPSAAESSYPRYPQPGSMVHNPYPAGKR